MTFTAEGIDYEEWMTYEEIVLDDRFSALRMDNWQYYDGYIYFNLDYSYSENMYLPDETEIAYLLGRINLEDKSIEIVLSDASVFSYVVYDGWIYYSDNGFVRNDKEEVKCNTDVCGLYKVKIDGSGNQKLLSFKLDDEFKDDFERASFYSLSIYNEKLYYIDTSKPFDSRLYRMNLDGTEIEQVTSQGTYEYTFDADANKVYYVSSSFGKTSKDTKEIYEVSLNNYSEKKIADYSVGNDQIHISCLDSVLYITSPNQMFKIGDNYFGTKENPAFIGIYYDLKNKKATAGYTYGIREKTESGFDRLAYSEYYTEEYKGDLFKFYK